MIRSVLALTNLYRECTACLQRGEGEEDRLEEVGLHACMVLAFFTTGLLDSELHLTQWASYNLLENKV